MRLPKFALDNHQFASILVIILVLIGIVSFITMPRSEDPQVTPAGTSVFVIYPGANPADLEELIVDPIEESLNELEDIKEIRSRTSDGLAIVEIEFLTGSDPDDKFSDVTQKVNSIKSQLPEDILQLDLVKWTITDVKILQVALLSDGAEYRELEKEADRLKDKFEKVNGVMKIELWAFPEQEIRVSVDMERIAKLNIPLNQIIGAIKSDNTNIPGGNVDLGNRRFNIQTSGSYESIDEINNTIISSLNRNIVYLKDVADVNYSYEDNQYYARYNGKRAIYVTATQKVGTNIFNVMDGLKSELENIKTKLPSNIKAEIVFDQSKSVASRLEGFFLNLLQGLLLVGLIVILAVGLRASFIVMLVIPVSILIGVGLLDFSNYGLEQMSIAGLVIALGLLVDNAIVVTENISRFMKQGYSPLDAAVKGTAQIGWAIVSSTTTTVLAFIPIILMQDITGDFIRSMPMTVVYTLTASLLVSLMITPYLTSKWIKPEMIRKDTYFGTMMNNIITNQYRKSLDFALKKPKLVITLAVIVFIASLGLFPLIGISFFPKAEKPLFLININTPDGTSLDKTNEVALYVESVLKEKDEITHYASNIGHGNPRIYYNVMMKRATGNHAQIFVQLDEFDLDEFNNLLDELRDKFSVYPGAKIEVKEFEQGPPVEAPIAIRILGDNLDILRSLSRDVEKIFSETKGTINVNNPLSTSKTDLYVNINRAKAGMLGVQISEIDRTVRAAIAGLVISTYNDANGKEYNIVVRSAVNKKPRLEDFDKIYVSSVTGAQVPLKQFAAIEFIASPMSINHYDLSRNVMITADVSSGYPVNETTNSIIKKLENYNWPKGYSYFVGGELKSQSESFGGMSKALIVALVGIFGVLVLQFRSYSQPLIVFSAIPLAVVGAVVALLITGNTFSFTAFVGITSLVGIVVNNSIILVDYTNQLRETGKGILDALKEAGETRFVPIVLTTATTIGGLLPLTLGGGTMWAPMGWTIIGGLTMSTFLTLIVVPVLYKLYTK